MERINILKNKLKTAKCNFSKYNTNAQDDFDNFKKSKDAPQKKQMPLAEGAPENLSIMGEKLKIVKTAGENIIGEIDDHGSKVDKPKELVKTINSEIDAYEEKMKEFMTRNDGIILEAEAALSNVGETQSQQVTTEQRQRKLREVNLSLPHNHLQNQNQNHL